MNNSKKKLVQTIALSALMVSAIAGPAAASTETATVAQKPAQAVTMGEAASALKLQDPLTLAKEYAPDTVSAWESLLEKYESLHEQWKPVTVEAKVAPTADSSELVPGEVQVVKAVPVQDGKPVNSESAQVTVELGGLKIAGKDGNVTLMRAMPIADSLLQGQIDLAKAVESKDAEAIKAELADLFDRYEAEIDTLEQRK